MVVAIPVFPLYLNLVLQRIFALKATCQNDLACMKEMLVFYKVREA